jgi:hypothetical protein
MREIRRRHAKDLVAHMLVVQERAPEGARNILRSLSAMAEDAIADDLAEVNPWRGVKVRDGRTSWSHPGRIQKPANRAVSVRKIQLP